MPDKDIRWIQRFNNYKKALAKLGEAISLKEQRDLSELEQQGLIQGFEITFDLAWKTLQDLLRERVDPEISGGPNVILSKALECGYIRDEDGWKALKKSREITSHTYDEEAANEIAENISDDFYGLFIQLETRLQIEQINQEKQP